MAMAIVDVLETIQNQETDGAAVASPLGMEYGLAQSIR